MNGNIGMVTKESVNDILSHYNCVSGLLEIKTAKNGSGVSFIITTSKSKYFLKFQCRMEDVEIIQMFHTNSFAFKYPSIYLNTDHQYITKDAILYEYLEGSSLTIFDKEMTYRAIRFLFQYNQELARLKSKFDLSLENHWDYLRNEKYLLSNAISRIKRLDIPKSNRDLITKSLVILKRQLKNTYGENRQFIHLDPGPDNFLVIKNEIFTLIDYTLAFNHELLSLAHFLYWNYLQIEENYNQLKLEEYLSIYYNGQFTCKEQRIFLAKILEASVYRVLGPLFEMESKGCLSIDRLTKRLYILHWISELIDK